MGILCIVYLNCFANLKGIIPYCINILRPLELNLLDILCILLYIGHKVYNFLFFYYRERSLVKGDYRNIRLDIDRAYFIFFVIGLLEMFLRRSHMIKSLYKYCIYCYCIIDIGMKTVYCHNNFLRDRNIIILFFLVVKLIINLNLHILYNFHNLNNFYIFLDILKIIIIRIRILKIKII